MDIFLATDVGKENNMEKETDIFNETDKLWKAITEIQARLDVIDYKQRTATDFIDNLPNLLKNPKKKGFVEDLMNKIYKR